MFVGSAVSVTVPPLSRSQVEPPQLKLLFMFTEVVGGSGEGAGGVW